MEFLGLPIAEWVGYLASAVLLVSFTMKSIRTLRIVNSIGAVLFVVYGIMLATSWPIIITNVAILGINIFYLTKKENKP